MDFTLNLIFVLEVKDNEQTRNNQFKASRSRARQRNKKAIYRQKRNIRAHQPRNCGKVSSRHALPCREEKLVDNAQNKGAPSDVINLIKKLPEKTYVSPIDITKEMGRMK